nr:HAMP domain-containing sensor histidine kinase [Nocardioides perillae]
MGHDLGRAVLDTRLLERERRLVAELQAVDRYRAQLVSTVAHELRTPLSAIVGHSELALDRDGLDAGTRDALTAVQRSAGRIDGLVRDLLALSRAGDPQAEVERLPVDLRAVVDDVHDLLGLAAAEQGVELVVEGDPAAVVPGDATLLDRVVQNLVGNAVKYSPGGGRVTVSLRRGGGEVALAVADEGIGIAADELDRLFGEFYRSGDPAARAQPGTGLGLAIVERIVARHGGRVTVTSQPGRGSTFTVHLPAAA